MIFIKLLMEEKLYLHLYLDKPDKDGFFQCVINFIVSKDMLWSQSVLRIIICIWTVCG